VVVAARGRQACSLILLFLGRRFGLFESGTDGSNPLSSSGESEFWHGPTQFGEGFSQAATMLQPVGGMGRIGDALGRRLGTIITYNAEVIALRRSGDDARVLWRDRASGAEQTTEAPYVLCTIPFPVLCSQKRRAARNATFAAGM
jgi:Flavin containing amine oxidoreductase